MGMVTLERWIALQIDVTRSSPYIPVNGPNGPALIESGDMDRLTMLTATPDATYTTANATRPTRRSRITPTCHRHTALTSRASRGERRNTIVLSTIIVGVTIARGLRARRAAKNGSDCRPSSAAAS